MLFVLPDLSPTDRLKNRPLAIANINEILVLDCQNGQVGFCSDSEWYGWCFDGLKGKLLKPAVSCVYAGTVIDMDYINGTNSPPSLQWLAGEQLNKINIDKSKLPYRIKRVLS